MSTKLFPHLGPHGWTDSVTVTADLLLAQFMVAEYSQTYVYRGKVSSWPYIQQLHNGESIAYAQAMQEQLVLYFSRYFNNVSAEVTAETNVNTPSIDAISIYLEFTDESGTVYQIARLANLVDGKFAKLIAINNGE